MVSDQSAGHAAVDKTAAASEPAGLVGKEPESTDTEARVKALYLTMRSLEVCSAPAQLEPAQTLRNAENNPLCATAVYSLNALLLEVHGTCLHVPAWLAPS
jgi:hypothetical protein